ncbi:uncharacterized protein LOC116024598 isoform X1 [Ipomoea triloba]|uniref:uncharacterized protein LOC116024598 isoform X1 n=1 Tax=Ipomoea triloba TaxID=35885 RepID=UPI00125DDC24|nr:uncharacterized protein LOC116024598 isoform X1 [Ipomoea triloba]
MVAVNMGAHFFLLNPKITGQVQCRDILVPYNSFGRKFLALRIQYDSLRICTNFPAVQSVTSGLEDAEVSTVQYEEFSVSTSVTDSSNELKITVDVSGSKTQEIFDDVFSKMVAEAPPIPGFRRVKGGKTPNIPRSVLLEVLGHLDVYNRVIKQVINLTIGEYVEKEGLKVGKNLSIEQSFEELEALFEPGNPFRFSATLKL